MCKRDEQIFRRTNRLIFVRLERRVFPRRFARRDEVRHKLTSDEQMPDNLSVQTTCSSSSVKTANKRLCGFSFPPPYPDSLHTCLLCISFLCKQNSAPGLFFVAIYLLYLPSTWFHWSLVRFTELFSFWRKWHLVKYWRHSSLDFRAVMGEKNYISLTRNPVSGDIYHLLTEREGGTGEY